ncbi:hypothetical protein B0O99DRAFT_361347 [Bisporella sp. PMI_857]|nr:hypothetical protein B0O99DRAFT_361347 [Bisporella sp. PMI_857]
MRVLLLGATGNLGRRCVPALLAHHHVVTVYVRDPSKLESIFSPEVINSVRTVVGDATDSSRLREVIVENDIQGIVDVAGNQVAPWKEYLMPKIAKAVSDTAIAVGKERKKALRVWLVSGFNILKYPGTPYLFDDYIPRIMVGTHTATKDVIDPILRTDMEWSLICVGMMYPTNPKQTIFHLLESPRNHNLLLQHTSPPAWDTTWLFKIPWIGPYLDLWVVILWSGGTKYEDVADFLAGDLESGSDEWVCKRVGMRDKDKLKVA